MKGLSITAIGLRRWSEKYLVTYESLPIKYAAYERLDKCRKFNSL